MFFSSRPAKPDVERILSTIATSKLVTDALEKEEAERLARRHVLANRLVAMEREAEAAFPILTTTLEKAIENTRKAQDALRKAEDATRAAHLARSAASYAYSRDHDDLEHQLVETAAPEIRVFVEEMRDELAKHIPVMVESRAGRNPITGKMSNSGGWNTPRIDARREALRAAIHQAEEMRLEPDQSGVPARLNELRAALPKV